MKITVRARHIEQGECKSPQKCAIAAAIKEFRPDISYVAVRTNGITITGRSSDGGDGYRCHYAVPIRAARAIIAFDEGKTVEPFTFWAKLIDAKPIKSVSPEQKQKNAQRTQARRTKLANNGESQPKYGRLSRIAGI